MRRGVLVLAGLLLAAGCGESRERLPQTLISGIRVMAVRADPPEIHPLSTADLEVLVVDTEERELGFLWIACDPAFDPEPGGATFSACQEDVVLADPSAAGSLATSGAARPLSFDLRARRVTWRPPVDDVGAPVDLFAVLPPGDPRREVGGAVTVLTVVAPLEVLEDLLVDPESVELTPESSEVVVKRLALSEKAATNTNPGIDGLRVEDERFEPGTTLTLPTEAEVTLAAVPAEGSVETFEYRFPDGREEQLTETLIVSWYSTAGRFLANRSSGDEENTFYTPGGNAPPPNPTNGALRIWMVARDGRGGTSWVEYPAVIRR